MLALLATVVSFAQTAGPINIPPPASRFGFATPLVGLPGIMADTYGDGHGLAQQIARARNLQARIMWVDGTANIDKVDTPEKIQALVKKIKDVGFNTIVYDVKPISGQVLYKSKLAPKIKQWKGKVLPEDLDPLEHMVAAAKANGITLLINLNAFSEGHALFKEGPGYDKPQQQTILYEPVPIVQSPEEEDAWKKLSPVLNQMGADTYIGVFTDKTKIPKLEGDVRVVAVKVDGTVVAESELDEGIPDVPAGGSLLVGSGLNAEFLEEHGHPGEKLIFTSYPTFIQISMKPDQQYPLMMNPHHPEVQKYALDIVNEIMTNYAVDGLVYDDRLRYAGMNADFSPLASQLFEQYVGQKLLWPRDVFEYSYNARLVRGIRPGKYYDAWMTWRSLQMRNWVARVRDQVKKNRPNALFGVYAGSWYGEYPKFGSNYAAPNLEAGFWFMTPAYQKTGFAPELDMLITGCYYDTPTIYEAMVENTEIGRTIEFAGQLSNRVARDETWTYAGIQLSNFKGDPEGLEKALQAACVSTQGVMVFDLSHDIEPMWPVFERAFMRPAKAPHNIKGLLDNIRSKRVTNDQWGNFPRPVPISAGSAGAGH